MILTSEQSNEIKKQLISQLQQIPNENNQKIIEQIKELDEEELETFLKQNNIEFQEGQLKQSAKSNQEKAIFESIISGSIPSFKIAENNKSIAILEINPLSKGHVIVLPKIRTSTEKIPKSALTLAQKLGKKLKSKLKADDIKIETFSFQEYPGINVIPIYKNKQLQKYKEEESELKRLKNKIETKTRSKRKKNEKASDQEIKLPEFKARLPY